MLSLSRTELKSLAIIRWISTRMSSYFRMRHLRQKSLLLYNEHLSCSIHRTHLSIICVTDISPVINVTKCAYWFYIDWFIEMYILCFTVLECSL